MYIFAEPVTEEQADEIQSVGNAAQKHFARTVVGVGKDDPEVQAAWQDIQGEVDEQVDEDGEARSTTERQEENLPEKVDLFADTVEETAVEAEGQESTETVADAADVDVVEGDSEQPPEVTPEVATATTPPPDGPLIGWTLTVRSKVNGGYVERPEQFTQEDDWNVEYHVQEIPEASRWRLYNALKERRRGLIGMEEQEVDKGLKNYRDTIQRFSNRGREWRKQQDKLNEEMGVQLYRPLGPGSDAEVPVVEAATEAPVQRDSAA
jgi:hypothetical protein